MKNERCQYEGLELKIVGTIGNNQNLILHYREGLFFASL